MPDTPPFSSIPVPSGSPQNLSYFGVGISNVRISWDLPPKNQRNGQIVQYQVTYFKRGDQVNAVDLNTTERMIIIDSLEKNTEYAFQVKAFTSMGAGPWSKRMYFKTFGKSE